MQVATLSPRGPSPRSDSFAPEDAEAACRRLGLTRLATGDTWESSLKCLRQLKEAYVCGHDTQPRLGIDLPIDVCSMGSKRGAPRALVARDDRVFVYDSQRLCVVDLPFATPVDPTLQTLSFPDIQHLAPVDRSVLLVARSHDFARLDIEAASVTHENNEVPAVRALAVAPDAPQAITGHDDGVRLWQTSNLTLRQFLPSSSPTVGVMLRVDSFMTLQRLDESDWASILLPNFVASRPRGGQTYYAKLGSRGFPTAIVAAGARTFVESMGRLLVFSADLESVEKWGFPQSGRAFVGAAGRLAAVRPGSAPWPDRGPAELSHVDLDAVVISRPLTLALQYDDIEAAGFVGRERWFALLANTNGHVRLALLDPLRPPAVTPLTRKVRLSLHFKRWRASRPVPPPAKIAWDGSVVREFELALGMIFGGRSDSAVQAYREHVSTAQKALAAARVHDSEVLARAFLALLHKTERDPKTDNDAGKLGSYVATLLAVTLYAAHQSDSEHADHAALVQTVLSDLCSQQPLQSWLSAFGPLLRSRPQGAPQARAWLRHVDATTQAALSLSGSSLTGWRDSAASSAETAFWGAFEQAASRAWLQTL